MLKDPTTFPMWRHDLEILLSAKELMDVVDGTDTEADQAEDVAKVKKWKCRNNKAKFIINSSLDKEVKAHILTCDIAQSMYETLLNLYQQDKEQTVCSLMQEFFNFKFDMGKGMMAGLSEIKNTAYRLKQLGSEISEKMLIFKIMSSLPSEFKHFSSVWDSTNKDDKTLGGSPSLLEGVPS